MTDTPLIPSGDLPLVATLADNDSVMVSVDGQARRVGKGALASFLSQPSADLIAAAEAIDVAALDAAVASATDAAAEAEASASSLNVYDTYALLLSDIGNVLPGVDIVSAAWRGTVLYWFRDAGGTALGGGWSPVEPAMLGHFGAVGDGVTDDTEALEAAYLSGYKIYAGDGTYRQVGPVNAMHPLRVEGNGPGKTIFTYEGMDGYTGSNGINLLIEAPEQIGTTALASQTSFTGATIKIMGGNGAVWFKTPRGQADVWTHVKPTFRLSDLYFTGDNAGDAAFFELNTTAWECCIDLGEGVNHEVSHISGAGNYDFREEPTANSVTSKFLRIGGSSAGPGGVLTPGLHHWWVQHFGTAIEVEARCIRGQFHEIAVHLGWRGLISETARTASTWGIDELEMSACNINVQNRGVYVVGPFGGMTFRDVDTTRARDGFDHGLGWVGVEVVEGTRITLEGGRAYSDATTGEYSDVTTGYLMESVRNLMAGGMLLRGIGDDQLDIGFHIKNPWKGKIDGLSVRDNVVDLVRFSGTPAANGGYTLSGIPFDPSIVTNRISYADTATRNIVNDLDEIHGTDSTSTSISSAGSETYTVGVDSKWKRYSFGAGSFTYVINMLATGAREGDEVEFTLAFPGSGGRVQIADALGSVQFDVTGTAGQSWYVKGRYLNTSPALFRILTKVIND